MKGGGGGGDEGRNESWPRKRPSMQLSVNKINYFGVEFISRHARHYL